MLLLIVGEGVVKSVCEDDDVGGDVWEKMMMMMEWDGDDDDGVGGGLV